MVIERCCRRPLIARTLELRGRIEHAKSVRQDLQDLLARRDSELSAAAAQVENETLLRQKSEAEERRLRGELDQRVAERTGELASAVRELKAEMAERQREADALRELQKRDLAALLDLAPDAIVICDSRMRVFTVNGRALHLFGWVETEVLGRDLTELIAGPDSAARHPELLRSLQRRTSWRGELRSGGNEGLILDVRLSFAPAAGERQASIMLLATDVTASRADQARFVSDQRRESAAVLAGGLADELNNLIAPVLLWRRCSGPNLWQRRICVS